MSRPHYQEIADLRAEIAADRARERLKTIAAYRADMTDDMPRFANIRAPEREGGGAVLIIAAALVTLFIAVLFIAPAFAENIAGASGTWEGKL